MLKVVQQPLRCLKNFTPLEIIPTHSDKTKEIFSVLNKAKEKVGNFQINSDQFVCNLEIKPQFRHSKTSVNALLSIKEFIEQKIKSKGLDYFEFEVQSNNKHSLEKLYEHMGMNKIETLPNGNFLYIGIPDAKNKKAILEDFYSILSATFA